MIEYGMWNFDTYFETSKSFPSLFTLKKCHLKKRHRIKIKPPFVLTFITRYLTSEVNKSRSLIKRYATISRLIFHVEAVISLYFFLIYMTIPLRLGNIWYFCIRFLISNRLLKKGTVPNKNYTNDVLCVTRTNTSAQITVTQQRSQYRNNS